MTRTIHVWKTFQVVPLLIATFCSGVLAGFGAGVAL